MSKSSMSSSSIVSRNNAIVVYKGNGNEEPYVLSNEMALIFGKPHKDVLKAIRYKMSIYEKIDPEFNQRNFSLVKFKDKKGEFRPAFKLYRQGFSAVALGFTGEKAAEFQIAYIKEFDRLQKENEQLKKSIFLPDFSNPVAAARAWADAKEAELLSKKALTCSTNAKQELLQTASLLEEETLSQKKKLLLKSQKIKVQNSIIEAQALQLKEHRTQFISFKACPFIKKVFSTEKHYQALKSAVYKGGITGYLKHLCLDVWKKEDWVSFIPDNIYGSILAFSKEAWDRLFILLSSPSRKTHLLFRPFMRKKFLASLKK